MNIAENINSVRRRIQRAAERSGRRGEDITLIAVTKTHPPSVVDAAIRGGITDIGENRVQEAVEKHAAVAGRAVWHMVGHLQRNKVAHALRVFDIIHSVDNLRVAAEIEKRASKEIDILVEINIGGEDSKSGVRAGEVIGFLRDLRAFPRLHCRGLMTIPPLSDDAEKTRHFFREVAGILREANRLNVADHPLSELSMGMTDDFEVAVEEGATMVRVGRALFGERRRIKG